MDAQPDALDKCRAAAGPSRAAGESGPFGHQHVHGVRSGAVSQRKSVGAGGATESIAALCVRARAGVSGGDDARAAQSMSETLQHMFGSGASAIWTVLVADQTQAKRFHFENPGHVLAAIDFGGAAVKMCTRCDAPWPGACSQGLGLETPGHTPRPVGCGFAMDARRMPRRE